MIEPRLGEQIDDAAARAGLRIGRAEHQPANARVHDRAGAHRARLDRHIQLAAGKPVIAECVRASRSAAISACAVGSLPAIGCVAAAPDDRALADHDRARPALRRAPAPRARSASASAIHRAAGSAARQRGRRRGIAPRAGHSRSPRRAGSVGDDGVGLDLDQHVGIDQPAGLRPSP